jgi:hypothetical protein
LNKLGRHPLEDVLMLIILAMALWVFKKKDFVLSFYYIHNMAIPRRMCLLTGRMYM